MQKNTVMFVLFSTVFLLAWYMFFQPKPIEQQQVIQQNQQQENQVQQTQQNTSVTNSDKEIITQDVQQPKSSVKEEEIVLET